MRRRALAAALLVALTFAGCGSDEPDPATAATTATTVTVATTTTVASTTTAATITTAATVVTTTRPPVVSGLATITVAQLPAEARATLRLIEAGGPFPFSQDGAVFEDRERLLPQHPRGWYHEYTVPTPGEDDRGARRLITGQADERYYTADHYESFRQVVA